MSSEPSGNSDELQAVDTGYDGVEVRRIILYRAAPDDLVARRKAYEALAEDPPQKD